jgi:hypothetical protein
MSFSSTFSSPSGITPIQIKILRHPLTDRHLGMALIDFSTCKDGKVFFMFKTIIIFFKLDFYFATSWPSNDGKRSAMLF